MFIPMPNEFHFILYQHVLELQVSQALWRVKGSHPARKQDPIIYLCVCRRVQQSLICTDLSGREHHAALYPQREGAQTYTKKHTSESHKGGEGRGRIKPSISLDWTGQKKGTVNNQMEEPQSHKVQSLTNICWFAKCSQLTSDQHRYIAISVYVVKYATGLGKSSFRINVVGELIINSTCCSR